MTLVVWAVAWLGAMAMAGVLGAPWWLPGACLTLGSPLALALWAGRRARIGLAVAVVLALLGGWTFHHWESRPVAPLAAYVGQKAELEGTVTSEPAPGQTTVAYVVDVRYITVNGVRQPTRGKVRISLNQYTRYLPGTKLRFAGKLEEAPVFPDFDYRAYLARHDVVGTMYQPRTTVVAKPASTDVARALAAMHLAIEDSLGRSLPEPEASLGAGIAFGHDGNLPDDLYADFKATGLAHLVAVSGANVALVTALTFWLVVPLAGRRWALLPAALAVVGYLLLAGFSASVVRAGIMALVLLLGQHLGRQRSSLSALGCAAFVMTCWSPAFLRPIGIDFGPQVTQDVGFQLSLAASAGIIVLEPWLRWAFIRAIARTGGARFVPEVVVMAGSVTLAATLATTPLAWAKFGQVSLAGPVANLVVEPVFFVAFWLSVIAALAGVVWGPAGWAAGLLAYYPLASMTWFAGAAADVPFASVHPRRVGPELALAVYALGAGFGWLLYRRYPPHGGTPRNRLPGRGKARMLAWGAPGIAIAVLAVPVSLLPIAGPGDLEMSALDVGQGDAILITTPHGHHVLVDGGPSGIQLMREIGAVLPHWQRNIDAVVLTHPQEDHVAGLPELLDRYHVSAEWTTSATNSTVSAALFARDATRRHVAADGRSFTIDGVTFEMLWPPTGYAADELNDTSVVLRISYRSAVFLLTGDLQGEGQRLLMASHDVRADVLKVPHHGSKTSDPEFLAAVGARVAVISVGEDNRFHHPANETLAALAGASVFRTDTDGRVTVRTDGKTLRVQTGR